VQSLGCYTSILAWAGLYGGKVTDDIGLSELAALSGMSPNGYRPLRSCSCKASSALKGICETASQVS